ncbi:MAG: STAS/SEC14 domain-containing protein [Chloroflexi bacterium]|nr:STAS/SEC14 domain-containing protein [Chloroflexota bacterium]
MPVEMIWLVPDKILLSRWIGNITAADINIVLDEIRLILENADDYIHSLIDLADLGTIDPDAIYLYAQSALATHPHRGRIAGVNPTFESEVLADLLNRMTQRELIRMFPTREAARDFLLQNDTPPPLLSFGFDPCQHGGEPR